MPVLYNIHVCGVIGIGVNDERHVVPDNLFMLRVVYNHLICSNFIRAENRKFISVECGFVHCYTKITLSHLSV